MLRPVALTLSALLLCAATPAFAGSADGKWNCDAFGNTIVIGISDLGYIVANKSGASGRGTIQYDPYDDHGFLVTSGPLHAQLGVYAGKVADDGGSIDLRDGNGSSMSCAPR